MLDTIAKRILISPLLIYTIRCLIGFLIGFALYHRFPEYELFWTLLSIILVISPEEKDSRRLSIERFKSNLIGSSVALLCLQFYESSIYLIMFGIIITIFVCRVFKVMDMARVALVALLIIMVEPHHTEMAITPIFRCISVGIGCVIGLFIVIATSMIFKPLKERQQLLYKDDGGNI